MQIHISPRNIRLTGSIHSYVADKIGNLEHFSPELIGAHVAIWHNDSHGLRHEFIIKAHLALPGPDLHAEDRNLDLYLAIDAVANKLEEQLRHRKSRLISKRRTEGRKIKVRALAEP